MAGTEKGSLSITILRKDYHTSEFSSRWHQRSPSGSAAAFQRRRWGDPRGFRFLPWLASCARVAQLADKIAEVACGIAYPFLMPVVLGDALSTLPILDRMRCEEVATTTFAWFHSTVHATCLFYFLDRSPQQSARAHIAKHCFQRDPL